MEMKLIKYGTKEICRQNQYFYQDIEIEYLTFPGLEETGLVKQFFSTRTGGISKEHLASMNLSYQRGDRKENVDENFKRVARILQCEVEDFVCSDQTHTTNVRKITGKDRGKGVTRKRDYTDIDGLITNEPGIVLSTFYADCVPLYFVDPVKKAIGLSHSGWRGTVGRIGKATLEAMKQEYGTSPEEVRAAVGPSICQSCYEVSEEVALAFAREFPYEQKACEDYYRKYGIAPKQEELEKCLVYRKENGKYQLNLWFANYLVLLEAGVLDENIEVTELCTCCNAEYLFSHRASQGKRGNMGAFLMLKP